MSEQPDFRRITWTHTDDSANGRDLDGYTLRVRETAKGWAWALRPPSGGYSVYKGRAESKEAAMAAVTKAYRDLSAEIARGHEERIRRLRENKKRRT